MDRGGEDAVIGSAEIREQGCCCGESVAAGGEGPRFSVEGDGGVNADVEFSTGVEGDAGSHGFGARKLVAEFAVNFAGIGAASGVF